MPKTKTPPLADWLVRFTDTSHRTVRATSLHIREGSYVLSDTYGHPLFAAPLGAVLSVRRLEPGEEVPAEPEPPAPKPIERIELEPKTARSSRRGK
jgi:hypothetical protein